MLSAVLDLLAPHRCVTCGRRGAVPWCADCARVAGTFATDPATSCPRCGGGADGHACWIGTPPVDSLRVRFRYGGPVADAVVVGKTRGVHPVWPALAALLAPRLDDLDVDVVTWVPAPRARRRQRGYDHAELLARSLAADVGRPAVGLLVTATALPDRGQVDASHRAGLPDDAYRSARGIRGASVLLVDDVLTTGATLRAAGGALRGAGASTVHGAVVARAGAHPLRPPPAVRTGVPAEQT